MGYDFDSKTMKWVEVMNCKRGTRGALTQRVLEYDALGYHRVPRCDKNLLVMIMSYQEEYFE